MRRAANFGDEHFSELLSGSFNPFLLVRKLPQKFHIGTEGAIRGNGVSRRAPVYRSWMMEAARLLIFLEKAPLPYLFQQFRIINMLREP